PVGVGGDEVQAGCRAPVPEEPRLDVLRAQRLAQQRVVEPVDLPDGEVVGGAPPRVDALDRGVVRGGAAAATPPVRGDGDGGGAHVEGSLCRWSRPSLVDRGRLGHRNALDTTLSGWRTVRGVPAPRRTTLGPCPPRPVPTPATGCVRRPRPGCSCCCSSW